VGASWSECRIATAVSSEVKNKLLKWFDELDEKKNAFELLKEEPAQAIPFLIMMAILIYYTN
jgi:hypothetical protein